MRYIYVFFRTVFIQEIRWLNVTQNFDDTLYKHDTTPNVILLLIKLPLFFFFLRFSINYRFDLFYSFCFRKVYTFGRKKILKKWGKVIILSRFKELTSFCYERFIWRNKDDILRRFKSQRIKMFGESLPTL